MSATRVERWKRCTLMALVCTSLVGVTAWFCMHHIKGRAEAGHHQLQAARIELQRSSDVLQWLQQHTARLAVLSLGLDELATLLVDAISSLTADDGVVDWRFEQHELAASHYRSTASLPRALALTLVVDVSVEHSSQLLDLLDQLRAAISLRPVQIRRCRIERTRPTEVRSSGIAAIDHGQAVAAPQLTGRCELEWPWWEET